MGASPVTFLLCTVRTNASDKTLVRSIVTDSRVVCRTVRFACMGLFNEMSGIGIAAFRASCAPTGQGSDTKTPFCLVLRLVCLPLNLSSK